MATIDDTQAGHRLSERLRNSLALAQTRIHTMETRAKNQWDDLPTQVRAVVDRALALLRTTLDLPSRADLSELVERMDAIDRKLVALEKRQTRRAAAEAAANAEAATSEAVMSEATTRKAATRAPEAKTSKAEATETTRKTVKSTSAGKTVKAATRAARPAGPDGAARKTEPAQRRKKGRRGGSDGASA